MQTNCPTFIIHLDAPPEKRWRKVIEHYKEYIPDASSIACKLLGATTVKLLTPLLRLSFRSNMIMYKEELQAIATQINMDPGLLLLLQLVYESFAACTSVIANTETHPIHIRTMDWDLPILKKLTFQAKYKIRNKTIFTGTSWAGYIGVLTGMRHKQNKKQNSWSVSINFRQSPESYKTLYAEYLRNIYRTLKGYWPISYLVRETLTHSITYTDALTQFQSTELISPTYITICGSNLGQGAVVTRSRSASDPNNYTEYLSLTNHLIQANIDHLDSKKYDSENIDIIDSKYRQSFVDLALYKYKNTSKINVENMCKIMCVSPCFCRIITIYTTCMIPNKKYYNTSIKRDKKLLKKAKQELKDTIKIARRF